MTALLCLLLGFLWAQALAQALADLALINDTIQRQLQSADCAPFPMPLSVVDEAVAEAQVLRSRWPDAVPVQDRLLVMILFSRGFHRQDRLEYLRCSLAKLRRIMMVNTTVDVFIWTLNSSVHPIKLPDWLTTVDFPRINVISLPADAWKVSCGLLPDSQWAARKHFDVDYYLMGRWRLAFSMPFAQRMGYEYHLQFDDDAMINSPIPYDIVKEFRTHGYEMGVFSDVIGEVPHVVLGLAELTFFWLKIYHYNPVGAILQHLRPSSLQSLTTDGWDRLYHPGYFIILSVSFWMRPEVQHYLMTVLRSQRDIEGRWQEQAVMNMMRLLFVEESKLWIMKEVDIGHNRHKRQYFDEWCVKSGVLN